LNVTAAPDAVDEDELSLHVTLIDASSRRIRAPASSTLHQLGEITAATLKIGAASDFAFFQVTEGLDAHRLLPDTTVISTLLAKWKKLEEMTRRGSRLLFKRKYVRVDEYLQPGDLAHAGLTYRQAVYDFLHYPIHEDLRAMLEISARIVFVERAYFKPYLDRNALGDAGVVEQIVPEIVLKNHNRKKVAQQITDMYARIASSLDPGEHRLVTMSRVLSLMQRLRLFGAYYWVGRQIMDVPLDKVSIPEAPKVTCKLNARAADAEYFIVVDYFGVRFISAGTQPGTLFQKGFLFNEEAIERVLVWGANQNVLQFVVSTVNPTQPTAGRIPMTIAMMTPAAVDIAYAVHLIYSMKGLTDKARRQLGGRA